MINTFIDETELIKICMFGTASILGAIAAYTIKWADGPYKTISWSSYMWNPPVIAKSLITIWTLCLGAGGIDYLDSLRGIHVFISGAGVGYLVPGKVENI